MAGKPFPMFCSKPTIHCERISSGPPAPAAFHYEVTGAESAWITETCFDENETELVTQHPLELDESGRASGDFPTTANCDYCVYAENENGIVSCCDDCAIDPVCSISAALAVSDCGSDAVVINWSYDSQGGPPIDQALINGAASVLGNPSADSGSLTTTLASLGINVSGSAFYELELVVSSACGQSRCVANLFINCMDTKSQLRASVDLDELDFQCQFDLPTTDPEYRVYEFGGFSHYVEHYQVHATTAGMSALNGTYFFERDPNNNCLAETDRLIGSVTVHETYTAICTQRPYVHEGEFYWNVITYEGDNSATYDVLLGRGGLKFVRSSFTPSGHAAVFRTYKTAWSSENIPYPWDYHGLPVDYEAVSDPSGFNAFHIGLGQPQLNFAFAAVANCAAPGITNVTWPHRTFPVANVNFGCPADIARCNESNCRVGLQHDLLGTVEWQWI
jgi:hypothetical protein